MKVKEESESFSSVVQLCLTLCDTMNHRTPGLPVHHQLLEFTQTHVSVSNRVPRPFIIGVSMSSVNHFLSCPKPHSHCPS